MASTETVWYNVYIVYFTQPSGPAHEGIALVPAQLEGQAGGRFYHVKGTVGMGMDYECRPGYNFGRSRSFKEKVYQFQLPKSYLLDFESIASTRPPPYDPRALTESEPDPPVRDCAAWVAEVLGEVRTLLRRSGLAA
ncbi:hypothetical protein BU25DRAFT_7346 [Macroventuria anomochaeta]|uniref:Uncharacterized protein n=1 Tax=Macroventuria anomochaeta TaxID=301207 RepID=A0ACB6SGW1_9PLEO|nr:uncharacterized protein BU25DRAFT_7346 [Macroventuria anomochaeta]KAF2633481.1 hypothetical protein BU25DRAFT_7346 [Macroventuria anomochaeta]